MYEAAPHCGFILVRGVSFEPPTACQHGLNHLLGDALLTHSLQCVTTEAESVLVGSWESRPLLQDGIAVSGASRSDGRAWSVSLISRTYADQRPISRGVILDAVGDGERSYHCGHLHEASGLAAPS